MSGEASMRRVRLVETLTSTWGVSGQRRIASGGGAETQLRFVLRQKAC